MTSFDTALCCLEFTGINTNTPGFPDTPFQKRMHQKMQDHIDDLDVKELCAVAHRILDKWTRITFMGIAYCEEKLVHVLGVFADCGVDLDEEPSLRQKALDFFKTDSDMTEKIQSLNRCHTIKSASKNT
jgi:hypothetical protein